MSIVHNQTAAKQSMARGFVATCATFTEQGLEDTKTHLTHSGDLIRELLTAMNSEGYSGNAREEELEKWAAFCMRNGKLRLDLFKAAMPSSHDEAVNEAHFDAVHDLLHMSADLEDYKSRQDDYGGKVHRVIDQLCVSLRSAMRAFLPSYETYITSRVDTDQALEDWKHDNWVLDICASIKRRKNRRRVCDYEGRIRLGVSPQVLPEMMQTLSESFDYGTDSYFYQEAVKEFLGAGMSGFAARLETKGVTRIAIRQGQTGHASFVASRLEGPAADHSTSIAVFPEERVTELDDDADSTRGRATDACTGDESADP